MGLPLLKPHGNKITSAFGWRTINGTRSYHKGIDIVSVIGGEVPICAVDSGTVSYVGRDPSAGNMVIVQVPNGQKHYYFHLKDSSTCVQANQRVVVGQKLAIMGWTGHVEPANANGTHLHFEVRVSPYRWQSNPNDRNSYGDHLNPAEILGIQNIVGNVYYDDGTLITGPGGGNTGGGGSTGGITQAQIDAALQRERDAQAALQRAQSEEANAASARGAQEQRMQQEQQAQQVQEQRVRNTEAGADALTATTNTSLTSLAQFIQKAFVECRAQIGTMYSTIGAQQLAKIETAFAECRTKIGALYSAIGAQLLARVAALLRRVDAAHSPLALQPEELQAALEELFGLHKEDALTAQEYAQRDYTATQYKDYDITARMYDENSKIYLL